MQIFNGNFHIFPPSFFPFCVLGCCELRFVSSTRKDNFYFSLRNQTAQTPSMSFEDKPCNEGFGCSLFGRVHLPRFFLLVPPGFRIHHQLRLRILEVSNRSKRLQLVESNLWSQWRVPSVWERVLCSWVSPKFPWESFDILELHICNELFWCSRWKIQKESSSSRPQEIQSMRVGSPAEKRKFYCQCFW